MRVYRRCLPVTRSALVSNNLCCKTGPEYSGPVYFCLSDKPNLLPTRFEHLNELQGILVCRIDGQ